MKKIFAFILVVMFVVCIGLTAIADAAAYIYGPSHITMRVYTPNGKPLNMRTGPSLSRQIVTTIPNGSYVEVYTYGYYYQEWCLVSYQAYPGQSYSGYVMTKFLTDGPYVPTFPPPTYVPPTYPPAPTPTPNPYPYPFPTQRPATFPNEIYYGFESTYYTAMVQPSNPAGYANLRWAPSLQATVSHRYYANAVLIVMSQNSQWCQVLDENGNIMGFMMRQFLTPYFGNS